jgi:hypothetical protein
MSAGLTISSQEAVDSLQYLLHLNRQQLHLLLHLDYPENLGTTPETSSCEVLATLNLVHHHLCGEAMALSLLHLELKMDKVSEVEEQEIGEVADVEEEEIGKVTEVEELKMVKMMEELKMVKMEEEMKMV